MSHLDIMTALFDQDTVTRDLIASKERTARIQGQQLGERQAKLESIKSIMTKLKMNVYETMELLSIPVSEQHYYIQQIEGKKES